MKATAFFGEQKLKDALLERLYKHRRMDEITQHVYTGYENGKFRGCHLGCITHSNRNSHSEAERLFGISLSVGYFLEVVFERLPKEDCAEWVTDSIEAIPVGADLLLFRHHLAYWLLGNESPSAAGNRHPTVKEQIAMVRTLHKRCIAGENVTQSEWSAAGSVVWLAGSAALLTEAVAWSAARAAWSVAGSEESAARSVESAVRSSALAVLSARSVESAAGAVWSARSAAESALPALSALSVVWSAESAAWKSIAAKSLEIFRDLPVGECELCEDSVRQTEKFLAMQHV